MLTAALAGIGGLFAATAAPHHTQAAPDKAEGRLSSCPKYTTRSVSRSAISAIISTAWAAPTRSRFAGRARPGAQGVRAPRRPIPIWRIASATRRGRARAQRLRQHHEGAEDHAEGPAARLHCGRTRRRGAHRPDCSRWATLICGRSWFPRRKIAAAHSVP